MPLCPREPDVPDEVGAIARTMPIICCRAVSTRRAKLRPGRPTGGGNRIPGFCACGEVRPGLCRRSPCFPGISSLRIRLWIWMSRVQVPSATRPMIGYHREGHLVTTCRLVSNRSHARLGDARGSQRVVARLKEERK